MLSTLHQKSACSLCTFPPHGWQNLVLLFLWQHYLCVSSVYFGRSRAPLNIYQPQTHWRVVSLHTHRQLVYCLYHSCAAVPCGQGWGGVLSFQVGDDLDPCGSRPLKPPAAWRTWTRWPWHRFTTCSFKHVMCGRLDAWVKHTHICRQLQTQCTHKTYGANLPTHTQHIQASHIFW